MKNQPFSIINSKQHPVATWQQNCICAHLTHKLPWTVQNWFFSTSHQRLRLSS